MFQSNKKVLQFRSKFSVMFKSNSATVSSCPFFDRYQSMVLSTLVGSDCNGEGEGGVKAFLQALQKYRCFSPAFVRMGVHFLTFVEWQYGHDGFLFPSACLISFKALTTVVCDTPNLSAILLVVGFSPSRCIFRASSRTLCLRLNPSSAVVSIGPVPGAGFEPSVPVANRHQVSSSSLYFSRFSFDQVSMFAALKAVLEG